ERAQLVDTRAGERALPCATLADMFAVQARRTPHATALIAGGQEFSYRWLAERACRLAHVLLSEGAGPERVVGVALERSVEMVVSLLGVLLSGAAYLPLDLDYPIERLRYMVDEAAPLLVITTRQLKARLPESAFVCCLDDPAVLTALAGAPTRVPTDVE